MERGGLITACHYMNYSRCCDI